MSLCARPSAREPRTRQRRSLHTDPTTGSDEARVRHPPSGRTEGRESHPQLERYCCHSSLRWRWVKKRLDGLCDRSDARSVGRQCGPAILLAIPWWIGHFPSILHIGGTPPDLAWWLPGAVAMRIVIVWLYNNAGKSLFAAILFHALINVSRSLTYPTVGSHYDPAYQ